MTFRLPPPLARLFICALLAFAMIFAGCGKANALTKINKTIASVTFGLQVADSSFQAGAISFEQRREFFVIGKDVNLSLTELNGLVSDLPDNVIDGTVPIDADKKDKILAVVTDGLSRANKLVEAGAILHEGKVQNEYLKYAKPALTLLQQTKLIVDAWKTKPT